MWFCKYYFFLFACEKLNVRASQMLKEEDLDPSCVSLNINTKTPKKSEMKTLAKAYRRNHVSLVHTESHWLLVTRDWSLSNIPVWQPLLKMQFDKQQSKIFRLILSDKYGSDFMFQLCVPVGQFQLVGGVCTITLCCRRYLLYLRRPQQCSFLHLCLRHRRGKYR